MKKIKIISILLIFMLTFLITGCNNMGAKLEAPTIEKIDAVFDISKPLDVEFTIDLKNQAVSKIIQGSADLEANAYGVTDTTLTIKSKYLATLSPAMYEYTIVTAGGSAKFAIKVIDSHPYSASNEVYDWANSANVSVIVDFKGEDIVSLKDKDNDQTLNKDVDYAYTTGETTLVLLMDGYIESLDLGITVFTVKTTKGSVDFTLSIVDNKVATDEVNYKIPDNFGADLSFKLDVKGYRVAKVVLGDKELENDTEYTLTDKKITIKGNVLTQLSAGIYDFVISINNPQNTVVKYGVGTYGKQGEAHIPGRIGDYSKINSFERYTIGDKVISGGDNPLFPNTLDPSGSNEIVSGNDAISGEKSMKFYPNQGSNVGVVGQTFFGTKGFKKDTLYAVKAKVRLDGVQSLLFKFEHAKNGVASGFNSFLIRNNKDNVGSVDNMWTKDSRSSATYNAVGKYWDVTVYMFTNALDDTLMLCTTNGANRHAVIIDDLIILETTMSLRPQAPLNISGSNIYAGEDMKFILGVDKAYSLTKITNGANVLVAGAHYVYDSETISVIFKKEYLSTLEFPLTLTISSDVVNNIDGSTINVDTLLKLHKLVPSSGHTAIQNYNVSGATGKGVKFTLNLVGYEIESVGLIDIDKNIKDDSQAQIANTAYTYNAVENTFTINHAFLHNLSGAGRYKFTANLSNASNKGTATVDYIVNYLLQPESIAWYDFTNTMPVFINGTTIETDEFGGSHAQRYDFATKDFALSTLDSLNGIASSDMLMIKARIKMDYAESSEFGVYLGGKNIVTWNDKNSGIWQGAENRFDVVSLGYGYYDLCVYSLGTASKVEIKLEGKITIGDVGILKVKGIK